MLTFDSGEYGWPFFWGFYCLHFLAVTAYLTLPRFHAIMTASMCLTTLLAHPHSDGLLGDPVIIGLTGTEEQIHQVMVTQADPADNVTTFLEDYLSTITRRALLRGGHPAENFW